MPYFKVWLIKIFLFSSFMEDFFPSEIHGRSTDLFPFLCFQFSLSLKLNCVVKFWNIFIKVKMAGTDVMGDQVQRLVNLINYVSFEVKSSLFNRMNQSDSCCICCFCCSRYFLLMADVNEKRKM